MSQSFSPFISFVVRDAFPFPSLHSPAANCKPFHCSRLIYTPRKRNMDANYVTTNLAISKLLNSPTGASSCQWTRREQNKSGEPWGTP